MVFLLLIFLLYSYEGLIKSHRHKDRNSSFDLNSYLAVYVTKYNEKNFVYRSKSA